MTTKPETPQDAVNQTARELKLRARSPDIAKARLTPTWTESQAMRDANPFMEVAQVAVLGGCILMAVEVSDKVLRKAPKGASKVSWSLHDAGDCSPLASGPASSIEQAKRLAYVAYRAAHGVILGGDA